MLGENEFDENQFDENQFDEKECDEIAKLTANEFDENSRQNESVKNPCVFNSAFHFDELLKPRRVRKV